MYLTRVKLDISKRQTQMGLSSPNKFHGAIESAFLEKQERNLWRIDKLGENSYLLLLSKAVPDMTQFQKQFGEEGYQAETKDYNALLDRIVENSLWRFRLVANPTYCTKTKSGRGRITAHITPEHQLEWLKKRAVLNGFTFYEDSCIVSANGWRNFHKKSQAKNVQLMLVSFEGVLQVKDSELFKQALIEGIGRGKAYGAGLLTIHRI